MIRPWRCHRQETSIKRTVRGVSKDGSQGQLIAAGGNDALNKHKAAASSTAFFSSE
jgi:hypothetical protein